MGNLLSLTHRKLIQSRNVYLVHLCVARFGGINIQYYQHVAGRSKNIPCNLRRSGVITRLSAWNNVLLCHKIEFTQLGKAFAVCATRKPVGSNVANKELHLCRVGALVKPKAVNIALLLQVNKYPCRVSIGRNPAKR